MNPLPIEAVIPLLRQALEGTGSAVLVAEPGAGKTTMVPWRLLSEPWLEGRKIIMLEPRRLAARASRHFGGWLIRTCRKYGRPWLLKHHGWGHK